MRNDLARPCKECPFRTDLPNGGYLTRERVLEISASLLIGQSFPCHKTVDYDADNGQGCVTSQSQQCAGAEIFLAHQGQSTQWSRIAGRLGFKVSTLDMDAPVARSEAGFLEAHGFGTEAE